MTVTPRERHRVRQFALALDGGAAADPGAAHLTRVAAALGGVNAAAPLPGEEFRAALRNRLVAVGAVATRPAGGMPQAAPWRRRLVAAGAVLAISTGGAAATAVASTDALPGDTLYDVKRAVEQVQLALAPTELAKAERYLEIASTRLAEVRALLAENAGQNSDPVLVAELRSTLGAMSEAVAAGSAHYFAVFERTGDASVLADLKSFLAERADGLAAVAGQLPAELLGSQEVLVGELENLARRVAVVTGEDTKVIAPAMSAAAATSSLTEPTGTALTQASRGYGRETLAATGPVETVLSTVGETANHTLTATTSTAAKAAAQAAEAAKQAARESAAKAEEARARSQEKHAANAEKFERDVRKVVEVDAASRQGRLTGVEVSVLPESARDDDRRISVLRTNPTGRTSAASPAGSNASSRLLSVLPLPDVTVDAHVPGSLTSALDLAQSRLGGKHLRQ